MFGKDIFDIFWLFFFLNTSNIFFLGLFLYNKSMLYSYNLSVWKAQCSWKILKGDLVFKKRNAALLDLREKFTLTYEGPYVVKKVFSEGVLILTDMDGEEFQMPMNSKNAIRYYAQCHPYGINSMDTVFFYPRFTCWTLKISKISFFSLGDHRNI